MPPTIDDDSTVLQYGYKLLQVYLYKFSVSNYDTEEIDRDITYKSIENGQASIARQTTIKRELIN